MEPLYAVRRAARIAGVVAITLSMLPAYAARDALTPASERSRVRDLWAGRWADLLLRLFAVDVRVVGTVERAADTPGRPARDGLLVVANHRSAIDIGILLRTFGGRMVSRADLAGWPLIGAAARKVGTVFVDRASAVSGATAIRTMRDLLKRGETVLVFPEGTTFEDDRVRPFQAGAFIAALRTRARIVPVGIAYPHGSGAAFVGESFPKHLLRIAGSTRTRVEVAVGPPIPVTPGAHAADLASLARDAVQGLVHAARARSDPG